MKTLKENSEKESSNELASRFEIFMLFSFAADVNWSSWKKLNGKDPCVNFLTLVISHSLYKGISDNNNFEINLSLGFSRALTIK